MLMRKRVVTLMRTARISLILLTGVGCWTLIEVGRLTQPLEKLRRKKLDWPLAAMSTDLLTFAVDAWARPNNNNHHQKPQSIPFCFYCENGLSDEGEPESTSVSKMGRNAPGKASQVKDKKRDSPWPNSSGRSNLLSTHARTQEEKCVPECSFKYQSTKLF